MNMEVWAISNQKGGVGKTTTTVALGGLLAQLGKRVLLVDIDPQASLTCYFQYKPEELPGSLYNCFAKQDALTSSELGSIIVPTLFDRLSLLPSSSLLSLVERQAVRDGQQQGMGLTLLKVLQRLQGQFDFVLIDSPPQLGILMVNTLAAASQLIIPVQTEFLALKGLERMLRTVQMITQSRARPNKQALRIHIMPTLYDGRTQASRTSLAWLQERYPEFLTGAVIPSDTQLRNASREGIPPSLFSPQGKAVLAYRLLLDNLLAHTTQPNRLCDVI